MQLRSMHGIISTQLDPTQMLSTAFHHKQGTQDKGNSPQHNIQGTGVAVEVNDERQED